MLVSPEAIGHYLLSESDQLSRLRPRPSRIAAAMEIKIEMDVPCGCRGWYDAHTRTIHIEWTNDPDEYERLVGHELAHLGMTELGVPYDEQEENARDVELAIHVPAYGLRKLHRRHGFHPHMFVCFYGPRATPTEVLLRAANLCNVTAILHNTVGERLVCFDELYSVNLELEPREERAMVKKARECGLAVPGPFGVIARPYGSGKSRRGVMITLDLEHALTTGGDWERLAAE